MKKTLLILAAAIAALTLVISCNDEVTIPTYTVTFNSNGGSDVSPKTQTVNAGDKATKPADPTRDGYDFTGWKKDGDTSFFDFNTPINADITLSAEWKEKDTFVVSFNSKGGSAVSSVSVKRGGKVAKPSDPAKNGLDFGGWLKGDGTAFDFDNETVSSDITLTAVWTKDGKVAYIVTFDTNGGSALSSDTQIVYEKTKITPPDNPKRDGYDFAGWANDGTFFDSAVTDDITLTAAWAKVYKVKDQGPTGGYIFYDVDADNGTDIDGNVTAGDDGLMSSVLGWRYLEAAPADLSEEYPFGYYRPDGTTNKNVGTDTAVGSGESNTYALISKMGGDSGYTEESGNKRGKYAALATAEWEYKNEATGITYDDWFLPSTKEFSLMEANLFKSKIGSLSNSGAYLTSSENTTPSEEGKFSYLWVLSDSSDEVNVNGRQGPHNVRPVRFFSVCAFTENGEHTWDNGRVIKAASCGDAGQTEYTCTHCSAKKTVIVNATGEHTWSETTATDEGKCKGTHTCLICNMTEETPYHTYKNYRCERCSIWGKGPSGGYVFYDCDADNDSGNADKLTSSECGWRFLEAAPDYLSEKYPFGWYCPLKRTEIADVGTDTVIGSGEKNTYALVSAMGEETYIDDAYSVKGTYAALACYNYTFGGYDDWFLPSREEVKAMYTNLYKNKLGSFNDLNYVWSSSEQPELSTTYIGNYACYIVFASDAFMEVSGVRHETTILTRPVRAFGGCTKSKDGEHVWGETTQTIKGTCKTPGEETHTCTLCGAKGTVYTLGDHDYSSGYRCSSCGIWGQGPSGGYVFYDCDADNDSGNADKLISSECGWRFLEAAPADLSESYAFGYYRPDGTTDTAVGTEEGIGKGESNTFDLVSAMGDGTYAANACYNYSLGVYDDWFLPSKEELSLMYENLKESNLGSFTKNWYLSSSEIVSEHPEQKVWCVQFGNDGQPISVSKDHTDTKIRPVRAFGGCTSDDGNHTWTGAQTNAPTCTEKGVYTYTCSNCAKTKTFSIPALGHDWDMEDGTVTKAATCIAEGERSYQCKREGCTETKKESIEKTAHNMVEYSVDCINGIRTFKCSTEGCSETETQTIEKGHTPVNYKCTKCGKWTTGPSGGYVFYDVDADNGLTADGKGPDGLNSYDLGWRYLEAAPADVEYPTGSYGYPFGYVKSGSGKTMVETETAIGTGKSNTDKLCAVSSYTFGNDSGTSATEEYAAYKCSSYSVTTGGNVIKGWFLPSSDELVKMYENLHKNNLGSFVNQSYWSSSEVSGANAYYVQFSDGSGSENGYIREASYRVRPVRVFGCTESATGEHLWNSGVILDESESCKVAGTKKYTCSLCGEEYRGTYYKAHTLDTSKTTTKTEATCTTSGSEEGTCSVCGKSCVVIIPALGHAYDESKVSVETNATCTATGAGTVQCTRCSETVKVVIPMTEHTPDSGYKCTVCKSWTKGPSGGYVFYDCDADNDSTNGGAGPDGLKSSECGWRFLEAAPEDLKDSYIFGLYYISGLGWQQIETETGVGSGRANTTALVKAMGDKAYVNSNPSNGTTDQYAAKVCDDYSIVVNGKTYDDWFLPSKDELELLRTNIGEKALSKNTPYWSSTTTKGSYKAYSSSAAQSYEDLRSWNLRVLPIRAFK